jgi:lipoprotein-releasing system ATP-binding protein
VVLPQMISGISKADAKIKAQGWLQRMGLGHRADHRPGQLSGGEQQRVAIARALANDPKVLLADEPTGNLDPHTAEAVFHELLTLVRQSKVAALIATHNPELAARMDRVVHLSDGVLR